MIDYQRVLSEITAHCSSSDQKGMIASYIPELANVSIDKLAMHLIDSDKNTYAAGDATETFSIQSISKVLTLAQAFGILGSDIWKRVGVEPSGDPFNHLSLLEQENGIPRNPLINAGAIVVADILVSHLENPKQDFLNFVRTLTGDSNIHVDSAVARSEERTGFRNYATANLLKSFGNLQNDVATVLDFYFHQCAISMSCAQLTKAFYPFMNQGKCLKDRTHLTQTQTKRVNSIMLTCGFYDEAGEFAFEVGLPGKSGVGGGIVALLPGKYCVATWSPGLNAKGNSKLGMEALEKLTTKTGQSIF